MASRGPSVNRTRCAIFARSGALGKGERVSGNSCFNEGVDRQGEAAKVAFEQYKLYVDSSSKVSDRRGTANTFLMTVNTALVSVYGLAAGPDATLGASHGAAGWLIPLAGLTIALGWIALIRSYRALNRAKFEVIMEIEQTLPVRLFDAEWRALKAQRAMSLTYIEQLVPLVFMVIYAVLLLSVVRP